MELNCFIYLFIFFSSMHIHFKITPTILEWLNLSKYIAIQIIWWKVLHVSCCNIFLSWTLSVWHGDAYDNKDMFGCCKIAHMKYLQILQQMLSKSLKVEKWAHWLLIKQEPISCALWIMMWLPAPSKVSWQNFAFHRKTKYNNFHFFSNIMQL